jgi:hypothetical protein
MRVQSIIALAVVALAIAACGGGGGSSPAGSSNSVLPTSPPTNSVAPATNAPLPAGFAVAQVTISIPKSAVVSSKARSPQTIGTGTQSIAFTLLQQNGAAATAAVQTYGLTSTSPGCSLNTGTGTVTCHLNINAPVGSDVFLAQTYATTNATGTLTGSGAVALSVALNASNSASLSLDGQVASVFLSSTSSYLGSVREVGSVARGKRINRLSHAAAAGKSRQTTTSTSLMKRTQTGVQQGQGGFVNSMRVFVIALDSAGNTVLNPSTFDQPVSLQLIYLQDLFSDVPDVTSAPDVTLSVQYSSSVDPGGCGGNSTTSANFGTIQVCSPSDVITATVNAIVPNGAESAAIYGSVAGNGNLPGPVGQPTALPTGLPAGVGLLSFNVGQSTTGLQVTDAFGDQVNALSANGLGNIQGVFNELPYDGFAGDNNTLFIFEDGFTGQYTLSSTCNAFAGLALTNNDGFGDASLLIAPSAVTTGCTITIGDGTNTIVIPMTITTTTVAPIS